MELLTVLPHRLRLPVHRCWAGGGLGTAPDVVAVISLAPPEEGDEGAAGRHLKRSTVAARGGEGQGQGQGRPECGAARLSDSEAACQQEPEPHARPTGRAAGPRAAGLLAGVVGILAGGPEVALRLRALAAGEVGTLRSAWSPIGARAASGFHAGVP
jgi:hypothetical protein